MEITKVWAVYFSGTGTTRKMVTGIADECAKVFGAARADYDFSLPAAREDTPRFEKDALVVFGTPVIAGRVPNVLLKYLERFYGGGAAAVPVVMFGNRHYDDALIELCDILEGCRFHTVAAAAFVGEHSFSNVLAEGRPDEEDMKIARDFARKTAEKLRAAGEADTVSPVQVEGVPHPYRGYYQPRDRQGNPIDIRKVKPVTGEACGRCGICADLCPMGAISRENPKEITGICIKCCACVKGCPKRAKRFTDEGYLYHQRELEEQYKERRVAPSLFL